MLSLYICLPSRYDKLNPKFVIWLRGTGNLISNLKRLLAAMQTASVEVLIMPEAIVELINSVADVLDVSKFTNLVKVRYYNRLQKANLCRKGDSMLFVSFKKTDILNSKVYTSYYIYPSSSSSLHHAPFSVRLLT